MSTTPRTAGWVAMTGMVGAVVLIALTQRGDVSQRPRQAWVRAESDVVAGDPRARPPVLAFRYRGKLCGVRGCLLTTIDALCRSPAVERLLRRIEPLVGLGAKTFRGVEATLVVLPSADVSDPQQAIGELARVPFRPDEAWEWSRALPRWPNSCRSVSR